MPNAPEVTDKDSGWNKLYTTFQTEGEASVFVGFLRSSGEYKSKDKRKKGENLTMATIAAIHEFGAPAAGIPERSFMRSAVDEGAKKISSLVSKLAADVAMGDKPKKQALGIVGEFVKNLMKAKITRGLQPPLKHRKGKPLYDTGQLINSIEWEVVGK